MKGSEKQIKWAEDIKRNVVAVCDAAAKATPAEAETWSKIGANIAQVESARELIDAFGMIRWDSDPLANFGKILSHGESRDYMAKMMSL